ncbi:MAG: serine/threonine protein phosphatase [Bacillota bacterium]
MFTSQKLDKVYKKAKKMKFDNDSKLVFMSDAHRGDNSLSDDFAHNQNIYYYALNYYYNNDYTYIEAGDGDELWEHRKFKHLIHAHKDVYCLLKKMYENDQFIMLYGNHNMFFKHEYFVKKNLYKYYDEYDETVKDLFKGIKVHEALLLQHEKTKKEILVTHGHQGDLMNDEIWGFMMFLSRYIWRFLNIIGFKNPASPSKNRHKRHKIEKNYSDWIKNNEKMMIIGHTHRPKFPKKGDPSYFNCGCGVHPRSIFAIEINKGKIALVDWKVRPNKKGTLNITKKYLKGPELLDEYMY